MRDLIELLEAEEYLLLENEQRATWLEKNFGKQLEARYAEEEPHLPAQIKAQVEAHPEETKVGKLIHYIMDHDPTNNKSYARWIALRYYKGKEPLEDINNLLMQQLELFKQAATSGRINGNIDAIKTFSELFQVVEPFVVGDRETSRNLDKKNKRETGTGINGERVWGPSDPMRKQATILLDDADFTVLIPKTEDAAIYFGKNTNWCTTSGQFNYYTREGPLYIILRHKDGVKWQFHFEEMQFMDRTDSGIELAEFVAAYPQVVNAIGVEKFIDVAIRARQRHHYFTGDLPLSLFPRELVEQRPDEILVLAIFNFKEFKFFSPERTMTNDFLEAILDKNVVESGTELTKILKVYASKFKSDDWWMQQAFLHPKILSMLPEKLQTDKLKIRVSQGMTKSGQIEQHVPEPYPDYVSQRYYDFRSSEAQIPAREVPEQFLTDENLKYCLTYFPEDIDDFADRYTKNMALTGVSMIMHHWPRLERLIENMPKQFLDRELLKPIVQRASELKNIGDRDERDSYLKIIAMFPHDVWPKGAKRILDRMLIVSRKFENNPPEHLTVERAIAWVRYHPKRINMLPKQFVTEPVVRTALLENEDNSKFKKPADITYVVGQALQDADPAIVKPEWVLPCLDKIDKENISVLQWWHAIPAPYFSKEIAEKVTASGMMSLDDPRYPKEMMTPLNVVAWLTDNIPESMTKEVKVETKDWQGRPITRDDKIQIPNKTKYKELWSKIPSFVDKKGVLKIALNGIPDGKYKRSENGVTHVKFGLQPLALVVPEELLTADILTSWMNSISYRYQREAVTQAVFKAFPESAYNPLNMAKALEHHFIDKVPDTHVSDEGMMAELDNADSKKKFDWAKLTPELMKMYIDRNGYNAGSMMRFTMPENHPLMLDRDIAMALLENRLKKPEGYSSKHANSDQIKAIYESPARRASWDQECYDLASNGILKLEQIPEKFQSDTVLSNALATDATAPDKLVDSVEVLNRTKPKLGRERIAGLLDRGVILKDGVWIDTRDLPHTKVPTCPGSYLALPSLEPKGEGLLFFDDKNQPLLSMVTGLVPKIGYSDVSLYGAPFAHKELDSESLMKYRGLIAGALAIHSDLAQPMLRNNGHHGIERLQGIDLYKEDGKLYPVEKLSRRGHGFSIDWAKPELSRYRTQNYFIYKKDTDELVARVGLDESKNSRDAVVFANAVDKPFMMKYATDFLDFVTDFQIANSSNEDFQKSDFYKVAGLRSPGRSEWYTLLENKLFATDSLAVWSGSGRVTITDKDGLIFSCKLTKHGYSVEFSNQSKKLPHDKISDLIDKARSLMA